MDAAVPLNHLQMQWRFNALLGLALLRRRRYTRKRWWVRPIFEERRRQGDYHHLLQEMRLSDHESFFNYFRMSVEMFDALLRIVGPSIAKASLARDVISPGERLSVTLRFLAAGDSLGSLSYQYRLGKTTVSNIVNETCEALWENLKDRVFLLPSQDNWRRVSGSFWQRWNFPNCIGAIDGKHVVIQAPSNSGSEFFNYKGSHSLVLLAVCDANYSFTIVDIGAAGRQSDGGVLKNSLLGRCLNENELRVPPPSVLPGSPAMVPHVLVGDEAFPLKHYLMRPYPGKNLTQKQRIFNYRLSRARRVVENAFGIMVARFRLLRKPIMGKLENTQKYIQAIVCLHNWIKQNEGPGNQCYCPVGFVDAENAGGELVPGRWRREAGENAGLRAIGRVGANNSQRDVYKNREEFATFFMETGQVPWQWTL